MTSNAQNGSNPNEMPVAPNGAQPSSGDTLPDSIPIISSEQNMEVSEGINADGNVAAEQDAKMNDGE